jgi:hypothetical protein
MKLKLDEQRSSVAGCPSAVASILAVPSWHGVVTRGSLAASAAPVQAFRLAGVVTTGLDTTTGVVAVARTTKRNGTTVRIPDLSPPV